MGKIFAPEFREESLEELLKYLLPLGVVAIRKMFQDPARVNTPLYVVTFLGSRCPERLRVGYNSYKVDTYYPSPSRCTKCNRWGHIKGNCHGLLTCNKCGQIGHKGEECTSQTVRCSNCKGSHYSTSKECPLYIKEKNICIYKVNNRVSFTEARKQVSENLLSNSQPTTASMLLNRNRFMPLQSLPDIQSGRIFPSLPTQHREEIPTNLR